MPALFCARGALMRTAMMMCGVLCVTVSVGALEADGQPAGPTAIRMISIVSNGPTIVVTIEGTGNLPIPTSGIADAPPRVYFDFQGIALKASAITASPDRRIKRIRAGVHSVSPLVTRVVLDLVAQQPFSVERGAGRVVVTLGGTATNSTLGIPPVPPLPEPRPASPVARETVRPLTPGPVAPSSSSSSMPPPPVLPSTGPATPMPSVAVAAPPARPSAPPPPAPLPENPLVKTTSPATTASRAASPPSSPLPPGKDLERYRRQISPALDRLRLQEPLLASLDTAADQTVDRVQLAVEEFERLRQELVGAKPPDSLRPQHDMLIQSTILALMATRLRLEAFRTSDPATLRNAGSAAAGAILLLDRVCADLGCPDSGR